MEARVEPKVDLLGCLFALSEAHVRTAFEIVNKKKLMNDGYAE
jgi:hypothetical protein